MIDRVVDTIAEWGFQDGYFEGGDAAIFRDELTWLLVNQYGAFNSPVWFNVGLHQAYGIGKDSGEGNYHWDREYGSKILQKEDNTLIRSRRAKTQYEYPQGSACFILSVRDDMESILDLAKAEAMLFKYGSGAGTNLSTLRSTREKLAGGGRPSGPLSFLRIYEEGRVA